MAIEPLNYYHPVLPRPETGGARKNGTGSAFDALLGSLRGMESGAPQQLQQPQQPQQLQQPQQPQEAAAELLRLEMMHASLALSGEAEPSPRGAALESLLSALTPPSHSRLPWHDTAAGETRCCPIRPAGSELLGSGTQVEGIGATASQYLGTPYRFGGEGTDGIDCSSFVQQVFQEHQIELPRTAREQINVGNEVAQEDLRPGDLVFFQTYASYPSHVGIYLGDGKMIHASSGKGEVTVSDMNSDYYRARYLGARRVA